MTDRTSLGDRMKLYEQREADRHLLPCVPIIARLDGRAFHTFCRRMEKPFDGQMIGAMQYVAALLVQHSHALIGYTQSDEITLVFYSSRVESQVFFNGRVQKMCSVLAGLASVWFAREMVVRGYVERTEIYLNPPVFDCRVWSVPTKAEAVNCLIWREQDAARNSLTALAQAHYSHKQLHGKNSQDKHEMLHNKGVNWNDLPPEEKRGSYWRREVVEVAISEEKRLAIPEKNRPPAGELVKRTYVRQVEMAPLARVSNAAAVVFDGAVPEEST